MSVFVCALREVTGSTSTSSQMLLLLWTMAIVGHKNGAQLGGSRNASLGLGLGEDSLQAFSFAVVAGKKKLES